MPSKEAYANAVESAYTYPEHPKDKSKQAQDLGKFNRCWRIQDVAGIL